MRMSESTFHIGEVGYRTTQVRPALEVSTLPYAAGDVIGGALTLTDAMRIAGGSGIWMGLAVHDAANAKAPLSVLLFDAMPTGGSYADQGAAVLSSADGGHFLGHVTVQASDYKTAAGHAIANVNLIGSTVKASASKDLYALVVAGGTPTYSASAALGLAFTFFCD